MIPYGHQSINKDDIEAVTKVLKSDWLTQGPKVKKFEEVLAEYCNARYAVVFSSGTAALHGAYFSAGLKKGDEFITTPLTFAATTNAGLYLGAKPVFADIDIHGNLDPAETEKKINSKTKLISVVDYAGRPAELDVFRKLAVRSNLILVEDACHTLGAQYKGRRIGSISDLTIFSFHPVKAITTGEGGAVLTDNKDYYEKLLRFRTHGITKNNLKNKSEGDWYYEMQDLGFNYRLTDIQAALGTSQLKRLDSFLEQRRAQANIYQKLLSGLSEVLDLPQMDRENVLAWHLYVIRLKGQFFDRRSEIFRKLREAGIGVQVHYIPVYWNPYYQDLGYERGLCPKAEAFYGSAISLPIFPGLKLKDQKFVVAKLREILK